MDLLLVEDDESFGYILKVYLEMHGYGIRWAKTGAQAIQLASAYPFGMCILDVMLPDISGFDLSQRLRREMADLPFIFLTAKSLKVDKLLGYKLGCDDYVTKPVDEELLLAKIQAILKRTAQSPSSLAKREFEIGKFLFDFSNQRLCLGKSRQQLTDKEARLLFLLCENAGCLVPREHALKDIWGKNDQFNRKAMDVFIFKLRKYLQPDPSVQIRNVHGKGFVLEVQG